MWWIIFAIIGMALFVPWLGGKGSCLGGLANILFTFIIIGVIVSAAFAVNPLLGIIAIWIVCGYFKDNQNN